MQYLYIKFIVQQIIGIIGSRIKVKRAFNIANTITNSQRPQSSVKNLEKLVTIKKLAKQCSSWLHITKYIHV